MLPRTPGVYIEEVSRLPPSIAPVATAIPAFIGFTQQAVDTNLDDLTNVPKRITSLVEYEQFFGGAPVHPLDIAVDESVTPTRIQFDPTNPADQRFPAFFLYYSMQLYFSNGGGPCFVVSLGDDSSIPTADNFTAAFTLLEAQDEPTLLVFPDSCLLSNADHADVSVAALNHCERMQDRFAIIDVRNAFDGETDNITDFNLNFRTPVNPSSAQARYGAAYFPYLRTSLPLNSPEDQIEITNHTTEAGGTAIPANTAITNAVVDNDLRNAILQFVTSNARAILPSSGAVAGVYARVDRTRGVWKAPANEPIANVIEPAVRITDDLNDELNVDPTSGKSVNAIRAFTGKGTLVWGARTLLGNDNENRYVPVRRFLIFAEESIKKAIATFVFDSNDANTWVKVRSMIESFLTLQWRAGALMGAKPENAFYVAVGLNETMSAQDVLEGRMIVEIGLAINRPMEFIMLRFVQMMPQP